MENNYINIKFNENKHYSTYYCDKEDEDFHYYYFDSKGDEVDFERACVKAFDFSKDCVDAKNLFKAKELNYIILPDEIDFKGVKFGKTSLHNIDLSKAKNLLAEDLFKAKRLTKIKLPDGLNLAKVNFANKKIAELDFSKTQNLSAKNLFSAREIDYVKLPKGLNFKGVKIACKSISRVSFAHSKNLSMQKLFKNRKLISIKLPQNADFARVNFKNCYLDHIRNSDAINTENCEEMIKSNARFCACMTLQKKDMPQINLDKK